MTGNHRPLAAALPALALAWVALGAAAPAFAQARSIQDFLTYKGKWNELGSAGTSWTLEGRYSVIGDASMQFVNCPIPFLIPPGVARVRGGTGVVEVSGKLTKEDGKLVFRIESMSSRPNDLEALKLRRFRIDTSDPRDWYRTADWARERGKFYDDQELLKAARELDKNGILTEFRAMNSAQEPALLALMQKAREKQVDEEFIQQMAHEGLWARAKSIRSARFSDAAYRDLLVSVSQQLPGSLKPLASFSPEARDAYEKNPLQVYEAAAPAERAALHRMLYLGLMTERILHEARDDGSNGWEIADRLRSEAPERTDLIAKYDQLGVPAQLKKTDAMTRAQLLAVTQRIEKMGRPETATEAKRSWLLAREGPARKDGARGLADLAEQWIDLLNDTPAAAQLYMDAWKANPQYTPASDWLTGHGYRLVEQQWVPEAEVPAMPINPKDLAIREGRVTKGMTAADVRAALGEPGTVTRMASSLQASEWWVYPEAGIVVRLNRGKRDAENTVSSVEKLKPGAR